jgi:hypothetical protein
VRQHEVLIISQVDHALSSTVQTDHSHPDATRRTKSQLVCNVPLKAHNTVKGFPGEQSSQQSQPPTSV